MPYIKDRLTLLNLSREDLDEIALWPKYQHPFAWANFSITSKELKDRWMVKNNRSDTLWFVVKKNQEVIARGSLIIPEEDDELIFGIVLRPDLTSRGIGTKCVWLVMSAIFEQTKYNRVWLETKDDNIRAKKSWEKVGFKPLGLHYRKDVYGKYARYMGYCLLKEDLINNE